MEYVYAALLIHKLGGQVTEEAVKKVIEAAGGKADDGKAKALVAALEGVDIEEAIKNASVATVAAAPAASVGGAESGQAKEEKKEEKKEEESQAAAGLGSLFG